MTSPNRITLISNQVNPNAVLPLRTGPASVRGRPRTYSADAKNTAGGAKNVQVDFYGTNTENPSLADEADWTLIGSVKILTDGVVKKSDGFVSDDAWDQVKAVISTADVQATLAINAFVAAGIA